MGTAEPDRAPCPDRIVEDVGGAFSIGVIGGSAFHFLKGIYNSPRGERLIGGSQAVRMNAPRIGGSFAVWGALFSTFDCTAVYLRQKEDPWNSIIAGAATGGFLQMRAGLRAASSSALVGGVLLALLEGGNIMTTKLMSARQNFPPMEEPAPNMASSPSSSSSSSWFGGLFGGGAKEEKSTNDGSQTKVLESFDAPTPDPPMFEFN